MAKVTNSQLKTQLKKNLVESKYQSYVDTANSSLDNLVDSVYQISTKTVLTTSGSGVVNIPITQPANSIIEDVIVTCTEATSHDTAVVGFKMGTAEGGNQIVTDVVNAIAGSGTSVAAGKGTSTVAKLATALGGGAAITLTADSGYTSSGRTLHAQVSSSTGGFDTNTGEFTVALKYISLK